MIVTEKFSLTEKEYFNILLTLYIKRRWWMFLWVWLLTVLVIFTQSNLLTFIMILLSFLLPFVVTYQFWKYAKSSKNKLFLMERRYEINNKELNAYMADGSKSTVKIENFYKIKKTSKYYLMYLAKGQFIIVPVDSFKSSGDKNRFEKEIVLVINNKI